MEKQSKKLKICTFTKLTPEKLVEVKEFVELCSHLEGCESRFYWENIQNRMNQGTNEILCYSETGELVSYLAIYNFEVAEVEVTLLVHPDYRTTAFYDLLWDRAKRAIAGYPVNVDHYVFTLNQRCVSLRGYVNKLGSECQDFTYQLGLSPRQLTSVLPSLPVVELRLAGKQDVPALAKMESDAFRISVESYTSHLLRTVSDPEREIWMIFIDNQMVGKIHAQIQNEKAFIYDFCIMPESQGKGLGSAAFKSLLESLFNQRKIEKVYVDVANEEDLAWYERFGFECVNVYEHWKLVSYVSPYKEREKQLESLLLNFHCYQVQDQMSMTQYKH